MLQFPQLSTVPFLCCSFCSPFCGSFHLSGVQKPSSAQLSRSFSEQLVASISLRIAWAIQEYTDPHHNPMIPHTFVLEPGLVIYKIYNGYWFWGRPSTEELRNDLREVTRKIRPDWDLSTPGLRENWEGDKTLLFPYKRN